MAQAARSLPSAPAPRLRVVPTPRAARRPSPAVIRRRRAVALGGLVALVVLPLAALSIGAGPGGAAARISALLTRGASRPATLCDHLSSAMLAAAGGRGACVANSPARGPAVTVDGVKVDGDRASAVVHRPDSDEVVTLVRSGGDWKVDDVR